MRTFHIDLPSQDCRLPRLLPIHVEDAYLSGWQKHVDGWILGMEATNKAWNMNWDGLGWMDGWVDGQRSKEV